MTGVFDSLATDMHSNQITSTNFHTMKSQDSPTLPVSTVTDSSFYSSPQPGLCAGAAYAQLGSYSYHPAGASNVHYSPKAYDMGFGSSYGAYGSYASGSSPVPTDTGKVELSLRSPFHYDFGDSSCLNCTFVCFPQRKKRANQKYAWSMENPRKSESLVQFTLASSWLLFSGGFRKPSIWHSQSGLSWLHPSA